MQSAGVERAVELAPVGTLRAIAHELRQPLSGIESAAYYLSLVLPRGDEKLQKQVERIRQFVEQAGWILGNALQMDDPAPLAPQLMDLEEAVTQAVGDLDAARQKLLRLELSGGLPLVRLDQVRWRALIGNLLGLLCPVVTSLCPLRLRTFAREEGGVCLELKSPVSGMHSSAGFGAGAALSLEIAEQITVAHGGSFDCRIDPAEGIRLRVMLP